MELVVIGDDDTRTGFKLAGITRTYPGDEAKPLLEEMLQDNTIGIIVRMLVGCIKEPML